MNEVKLVKLQGDDGDESLLFTEELHSLTSIKDLLKLNKLLMS